MVFGTLDDTCDIADAEVDDEVPGTTVSCILEETVVELGNSTCSFKYRYRKEGGTLKFLITIYILKSTCVSVTELTELIDYPLLDWLFYLYIIAYVFYTYIPLHLTLNGAILILVGKKGS